MLQGNVAERACATEEKGAAEARGRSFAGKKLGNARESGGRDGVGVGGDHRPPRPEMDGLSRALEGGIIGPASYIETALWHGRRCPGPAKLVCADGGSDRVGRDAGERDRALDALARDALFDRGFAEIEHAECLTMPQAGFAHAADGQSICLRDPGKLSLAEAEFQSLRQQRPQEHQPQSPPLIFGGHGQRKNAKPAEPAPRQ